MWSPRTGFGHLCWTIALLGISATAHSSIEQIFGDVITNGDSVGVAPVWPEPFALLDNNRTQHLLSRRDTASAGSAIDYPVEVATPPISFFWTTLSVNDSVREIPQCSTVVFATLDNPGSPVPTIPPLYYTVAPVGSSFLPITSFGVSSLGKNFTWTANLPVNTTFSFSMIDSANSSGGAVFPLYTIGPGSSNCTLRQPDVPKLKFTVTPANTPCGEVRLSVSNGVAPYNVTLLSGQSGLGTTSTNIKYSTIYMDNVVPAGQTFFMYVSDSAGSTSLVSSQMTSAFGQATCSLIPTDGSTRRPLGAIIGGVLGGIAGALVIGSLAFWWMRRRSALVEQQYQRQQHVSEYTNIDGTKPMIRPFVVTPRQTSDSDESGWDASTRKTLPNQTDYDHPYLQPRSPQSHEAYAYSPPSISHPPHREDSPVSPITPMSYHSSANGGPDSARSGGGGYEWPVPSSSTRGAMSHQDAYISAMGGSSASYDPLTSSFNASSTSAVDGLVDPNEFRPRVAGYANVTPPPSALPPGARRID